MPLIIAVIIIGILVYIICKERFNHYKFIGEQAEHQRGYKFAEEKLSERFDITTFEELASFSDGEFDDTPFDKGVRQKLREIDYDSLSD